MNKRKMPCGKQYWAVGQEGSMADLQEQYITCYECDSYIICQEKNKKVKKYFQHSDKYTGDDNAPSD